MDYYDAVYGGAELGEPLLLDLLQTQAVRRLAGVLQHGISGLIGLRSRSTRLEHSIGALLLVQRLGGSLTEQAAALLHDVSHTAFSHVIDFVYDTNGGESYHEQVRESYIARTDLPQALARHGLDWRLFLDESAFPLLEQPAPALCADRLDYFLRDSLDLGLLVASDVHFALSHLLVREGRIVTDSIEAARLLGDTYLAADAMSWSALNEVGLYELAARAIQEGLRLGAISEDDLWTGDDAVWARLQSYPDPGLQAQLRRVSPETRFYRDDAAPTFVVTPRVRAIDPDVWLDGVARPLSALDPAFARRRQEYLDAKQGAWPIRVAEAGR